MWQRREPRGPSGGAGARRFPEGAERPEEHGAGSEELQLREFERVEHRADEHGGEEEQESQRDPLKRAKSDRTCVMGWRGAIWSFPSRHPMQDTTTVALDSVALLVAQGVDRVKP